MSFWARESFMMAVLKSLPWWLRITIPSCLSMIFIGGWGGFFHYPLIQRQHFLDRELVDLQKQQKLFEQKLSCLQEVQAHYDVCSQKLALLPWTNKHDTQALFYLLMHNFKKHDLICKNIHPQGNKITALFEKQYVYFDVKGPFKNIKMFLHDVSMHDFLKYKKIVLLQGNNNMVKCQALVRAAYLRSLKG